MARLDLRVIARFRDEPEHDAGRQAGRANAAERVGSDDAGPSTGATWHLDRDGRGRHLDDDGRSRLDADGLGKWRADSGRRLDGHSARIDQLAHLARDGHGTPRDRQHDTVGRRDLDDEGAELRRKRGGAVNELGSEAPDDGQPGRSLRDRGRHRNITRRGQKYDGAGTDQRQSGDAESGADVGERDCVGLRRIPRYVASWR